MTTTCCVFLLFCVIKPCANLLVYPKLLESRSEDGRLILQVHPGLTLTLEKSSILADDLHFVILSSEDTHKSILNGNELERNLYHDATHMSSLIVDRIEGGVQVRGILNNNLRIAPLELASRSSNGNTPHEITHITESPTPMSNDSSEQAAEDPYKQYCDPVDIENRGVEQPPPYVFLVEVCIVVSINYTSTFNTTEDLLQYLAALLNAVELRYSDMECPKIQFQLNSVFVVKDKFVFGNEVCVNRTNVSEENIPVCGFDAEETLNKTRAYVNICATEYCDIVFHLTRHLEIVFGINVYRKYIVFSSEDLTYYINGTFTPQIDGMAERAGVCTEDKFAIGEDKPPTYSGLLTMAHEIGHLLGSDHDGCTGAEDCPPEYGNLMSSIDRGMQNKSRLSNCSEEQIRRLIIRLPPSCIHVNTTANFTNNFYPGENITHEAFCTLMSADVRGVDTSPENMPECAIQCCWNVTFEDEDSSGGLEAEARDGAETTSEDDSQYIDEAITLCSIYNMLDGMSCGENKTCLRGYCGNHNWTEIKRVHRTLRTFPSIL